MPKHSVRSSRVRHRILPERRQHAGVRPGITSEESARIKALEQEMAELHWANDVLRATASFFRGRAVRDDALC